MYLYDVDEIRCVVSVEWLATVTQFIETINADDLMNAEQENVNYVINASLHQCIKAAGDIPNKPYNFEVELLISA